MPAARTVLVVLERAPTDLDVATLRRVAPDPAGGREPGPVVDLPVVFDGPDLAEVAALTSRDVAGLVAALTAAELTVAFGVSRPGSATSPGSPRTCTSPAGTPRAPGCRPAR
ncbi:carboxyltransferase domain-containing protein [Blastococcus brunescens]|uniref:Carboxyltransferase domain-containing protein n=1 Tax=Blastococcus brunescens TaxID=1564165 RepID=A0ABZ1B2A5_9ACTN|nr:carboxyltransferase domain-containing protein [Blastococcus sp. BMG 8361]WRL64946.1 carboxyltransferase domain-containing protein [Blastococcus sp. BMG 8361]